MAGRTHLRHRSERDTARLNSTSIWHLPPGRFETFREITETTPLHVGIGLPGRVLASGASGVDRPTPSPIRTSRARGGTRHRGARRLRRSPSSPGATSPPSSSSTPTVRCRATTTSSSSWDTSGPSSDVSPNANAPRHGSSSSSATRGQLIESAHDAFVSIDEDGRITGWNAAAESMFGWTRGRGARSVARRDDHPGAIPRPSPRRRRALRDDGRSPRAQRAHRDHRIAPGRNGVPDRARDLAGVHRTAG